MTIPIIGQPKIGEDYCVGFSVNCSCGARFFVIGQVGVERACHKCGVTYKLAGFPSPRGDVISWPIRWARPNTL